MQNPTTRPIQSLEMLKKRLENSQELVVDNDGRVHTPDDPELKKTQSAQKTFIKPSRWFD